MSSSDLRGLSFDPEPVGAAPPLILGSSPAPPPPRWRQFRADIPAAVPGLLAVGLFLVWAVANGGFNEGTWYWGALVMVALTGGSLAALGRQRRPLSRGTSIALALFAAYVGWSYLSMTWAQDAGTAWEGSNRALLYLLSFGLMAILPWTPRGALAALLAFALGIGGIAMVLLIRVAAAAQLSALFVGDRLAAPTGYINSSAALFSIGALVAVGLASRSALKGLVGGMVRGLLLAFASAELDMALTVQSRGWLFTLPIVAMFAIILCRDRLAVTAAAILPVVATALAARRMLKVVEGTSASSLAHLAPSAGRPALLLCFAVFVIGALGAWVTSARPISLSPLARRLFGMALAIAGIVGVLAVGEIVSHRHLGSFVSRQWNGFTHEPTSAGPVSHFAATGSGRYDFWRVGLKAFKAHPIGGLGQDNFFDYYLLHRKTTEEPLYVHSLEIRMLTHTGIVGFVLFFAFMAVAIGVGLRARRRGDPLTQAVAAIAMLPLVDWVLHGSIDWFWEMPALSGPALGFLGMACALSTAGEAPDRVAQTRPLGLPTRLTWLGTRLIAGVTVLAMICSLAFPYLSVREVSVGTYIQNIDPQGSLTALKRAGRLNPLDPNPGLVGGAVALRQHRWALAQSEFEQSVHRDDGNWLPWLGAGLAASEQGDRATARTDFQNAVRINPLQTADLQALKLVDTAHPLSALKGLAMLTAFDN